ncbi:MAG TPA: serine/threonine-protein kinase [Gemmatimonadales bacterium]|nr:serine/threonine-protein kinase [Gemmatimonadales bacterium]
MNDSSPSRRWRRVDALFSDALERPPEERDEFLREACGSDVGLMHEVQALLARATGAERVIGERAGDFAPSVVESASGGHTGADDEPLPHDGMIGPWKVKRELGRGGMGAVFLAERADGQWDRQVAVKRVKRGMDTDEVLARFRYERQILASLEHPNIARLYDGGAAEDGRPYLVMEYVEGKPLTAFCDSRQLGVDERLSLFEQVCEAVQYAHRKLVVHRDLKPSNILVTSDGVPKLLDFGIAKLLDGSMDEHTPRTRTGVRVLTPGYASPEQVRGEPPTTSTDVYTLGVVLYELLAGRRPNTAKDEPEAPSSAVVRISTADGNSLVPADVAAARSTTPEHLRNRLAGDLDAIVLKAMADEPERRYDSVSQLLADLYNHRTGLPVSAQRPTVLYRAGRFVRRHKGAVAAAALILLSLTGGLGTALWQARAADRERDAAELARLTAEEERDKAEAVAGFLESLFAASNPLAPSTDRLDTLRVAAFLDRGASRLQSQFANQPLVQARMLGVVGRVNGGLGRYGEAVPLIEAAVKLHREAGEPYGAALAESLTELGNVFMLQGRPAEAERAHREALELRRKLLGDRHRHLAASLSNVASAMQDQGKMSEAGPLYDEALIIMRSQTPPDSAMLADMLNARMTLAYRLDDLDTALPMAHEVLAIDRALLGDAHPRVARGINNLAQMLSRAQQHEEAEPLFREAVGMLRTQLGENHPYVALGMGNHAASLQHMGRTDEADSLFREAIAVFGNGPGRSNPQFAIMLSNHADLLAEGGNVAEARAGYESALEINRSALGERHSAVGVVTGRLARLECETGDAERGEELFRTALAILLETLPPEHTRVGEVKSGLESCGVSARPEP